MDEPPPGKCAFGPPLAAFTPELQWSFTPEDGRFRSWTTPLVGNLSDDNGDGLIDLQDTPDVVLHAFGSGPLYNGGLYVLDGATGALHFTINDAHWASTPAIGDIDGDGIMEIVVHDRSGRGVAAYEHDGALKWRSEPIIVYSDQVGTALALADLDNDCDVEILFADTILDHHGKLVHKFKPWAFDVPAPSAADIDGDGDLEVLLPDSVMHHDGAVLFEPPEWYAGLTEAADFDGDGLPEVLFSAHLGLTMLEHDGTVKFEKFRPFGVTETGYTTPSAILDLDHDGLPEFFKSNQSTINAHRHDASVLWSVPAFDGSGNSAPTAFDLLGDGTPDVLYGDEQTFRVLDAAGALAWEVPRPSFTGIDTPVVADIDNDGAAEILVVTSVLPAQENDPSLPTLRVFRDVNDKWLPARRIWNQQTYHVTNVREDGTIPQFEAPPWKGLRTLHIQAHVGPDGVCWPPEA